jgi:hypothetical protein
MGGRAFPYGRSILQSIFTRAQDINTVHDNMVKAVIRYGSPKLFYLLRKGTPADYERLRDEVDELTPERDFVGLGDLEIKDVTVQTRVEFQSYISYLYELIMTGLATPLLPYLKNATEASAKVLMDYYQNRVEINRRGHKRAIENQIRWELAEQAGLKLSDGTVPIPRVNWGIQRSGVEELKIADVLGMAQGVPPIITPRQAREILRKMGVPVVEEEATEASAGEMEVGEEWVLRRRSSQH